MRARGATTRRVQARGWVMTVTFALRGLTPRPSLANLEVSLPPIRASALDFGPL